MQKILYKKRICALLAGLAMIVSVCFGQFTVSAETQQGAVGSQQPAIIASYTDADGNTYDGNALAPGNYTMTLSVSDLYSVSELQFTANYDESVLSFSLLGETLLPDTLPHTDGFVVSRTGGSFVFFITSTNSDTTVLENNCADIISIGITVKGEVPVDMQDVIEVDENPNFTFISVNYDDATESGHNCYALSTTENYFGTVYPMTCDLSPNLTQYYTVSAYVGALASPEDVYGSYPTTGAVVKIVTEDGTEISATTDETGKFVLENVPNGTYNATITYKYGFDRTFTIIVDGSDIESSTMVGIVGCNWDNNDDITVSDLTVYTTIAGVSSSEDMYDVGVDIDRSGDITVSDMTIYTIFAGLNSQSTVYADTTIQQ